jgi:hypothetical protein
VEDVLAAFTALCSRSIWPPSLVNAGVRLRCSLQSYASHRGHAVLWRMLKADLAEFEDALRASQ